MSAPNTLGESTANLSAADYWARLVIVVAVSRHDIPSLSAWARVAGVSVGSLRLRCYAAAIAPRRSLLFARLFRAVALSSGGPWDIGEWLAAADPRTLVKMAALGGLPARSAEAPRTQDFVASQRVVDPGSPAIKALSRTLAEGTPCQATRPGAPDSRR